MSGIPNPNLNTKLAIEAYQQEEEKNRELMREGVEQARKSAEAAQKSAKAAQWAAFATLGIAIITAITFVCNVWPREKKDDIEKPTIMKLIETDKNVETNVDGATEPKEQP